MNWRTHWIRGRSSRFYAAEETKRVTVKPRLLVYLPTLLQRSEGRRQEEFPASVL